MANGRPVKVVQPSVYGPTIALKLQDVTLADILEEAPCLREPAKRYDRVPARTPWRPGSWDKIEELALASK